MRKIITLSATALSLMACVYNGPTDGYYDASGNYVVPPVDTTVVVNAPATHVRKTVARNYDPNSDITETSTTITYYGHPYRGYVYDRADLNIPDWMQPPFGSCRIWYPDRPADAQPAIVDNCENIRAQVPAGAFVIYGRNR